MTNTDCTNLINSGKYLAYYCFIDVDDCLEEVQRVVQPSCQCDIDAIPIAVWKEGIGKHIFDDIESVGEYLRGEYSKFVVPYQFLNLCRGDKDYLCDIIDPYFG